MVIGVIGDFMSFGETHGMSPFQKAEFAFEGVPPFPSVATSPRTTISTAHPQTGSLRHFSIFDSAAANIRALQAEDRKRRIEDAKALLKANNIKVEER